MRSLFLALCLLLGLVPTGAQAQEVTAQPSVVLTGFPFQLTLTGAEDEPVPYQVRNAAGATLATGTVEAGDQQIVSDLVVRARSELPLSVSVGAAQAEVSPTLTPPWFSLLPPILAIVMALVFREAIAALFAGVWIGALAIAGFDPLAATGRMADKFLIEAIADLDEAIPEIILFSLLLGAMVAVIARNGGTQGVVEATTPFARTRQRGKIATWLAGMAIFFDDYANTLIVGNTMRAITDRLKISREKLAYLVDSTAAPLAAIVPLSTWVGYEISLIADGLAIAAQQNPALGSDLSAVSPLSVFLETIPYRFYPLLALYFAALTAFTRRDFGPMADAEHRAASGGGLHRPGAQLAVDTSAHVMDPKEGAPLRWWNAAIPVLTVILVVLVGLYSTGRAGAGPDASLMDVFGSADPFATLLWGSMAGCLMAVFLSAAQRILGIRESIDALMGGIRSMVPAMAILILAWSLGAVTQEIGTAQFLSSVLSERVPLELLPVLVFATAAAMSFATGTSWGTMAILLPLVIPLTVSLGGYAVGFGDSVDYSILLGTISSVLAGAIFGDHCSPISDTTVMSSMASGCDHVDHVRTQLPYALLVGVVGMLLGDIGTAYGVPIWAALGGGAVLLWAVLRFAGRSVDLPEA